MITVAEHRRLINVWLNWWLAGAAEEKRPGPMFELLIEKMLMEATDHFITQPSEDEPVLRLDPHKFPRATKLSVEYFRKAAEFWDVMRKILPGCPADDPNDFPVRVAIEQVSVAPSMTSAILAMRHGETDMPFEIRVDLLHIISGGVVAMDYLEERRKDLLYADDNKLQTPLLRGVPQEVRRQLLGPDYPLRGGRYDDFYDKALYDITPKHRANEHRLLLRAFDKRYGKVVDNIKVAEDEDGNMYWYNTEERPEGKRHTNLAEYVYYLQRFGTIVDVRNATVRANWKMGPSFGSTIPADLPEEISNAIFVMSDHAHYPRKRQEERRAAEALVAGGWMIETDKHGKKIMVLKPEVLAKANRVKQPEPVAPSARPGKRRYNASTALVLAPPPAARPRTRRAAAAVVAKQPVEDVL